MKRILKQTVRCFVIAASVLMIVWYSASKIVNIGSVVGALVFLLLGMCALFFERIRSFLKKIRQNKLWRIVTNITFGIMGAVGVWAAVMLCLMAGYANRAPSDDATLVVLGCQVNGTRPSLMLSRRLDSAGKWLISHPDSCCVVSGGKGSNEDISEAQCMYDYLVSKGISPERIYREENSVNTEENIAFSKEVIEENGLSPEMAIVTDGFHQMRASLIASRMGCRCGAVNADTPFHLAANFTTREIMAVTAAVFSR